MLKKLTLLLGLCVLAVACSGPQMNEQTTEVPQAPVQQSGPLTVFAPDGVEIAATVHSSGHPTMVLVHGWLCDQTYWENQIPALAEHYGVVTVDAAGHGLSGTDRDDWTIASLGADVAAVINELGLDDVVVVGHSMGGKVGLEVACLMPETVIGIIGVDTLQDADYQVNLEETEPLLAGMETDFDATCDSFVRSMFGEDAKQALIDHVAGDMCSGPGEIGAALLRDYVAYDHPTAYQNAGVPIRCINADKWPTNTVANQKYADFEVVILTGPGHFLMQEAPDELNRALIETMASMWAGSNPPTEG